MYRSVRNQCLSHLRSAVATEPIDDCGDVEEDVIDTSERDAQLWRAIDDLPKRCREVFLLSKHDGLSNAEIADELNVSIKTVENQITKAYSRLRAALGERHSKVFFLPFL
jgi:RNA polymerase sigma-70 factor (ECF subfamily)